MKQFKIFCMACFLMCALIPMDLYAASQESVMLEGKDHQVFATLTKLDQKDDIRSLQLSFQIKVVKGTAKEKDISFQFDNTLPSEVKEYRYHHDTGILTVYISGKQDLYTSETLSLGSVNIAKDSNVVIEVSAIEDSFKAVQNEAFKNDGTLVQVGEPVKVATGSMIDQNQEQPEEPDPVDPNPDTEDQNKGEQDEDTQKPDGGSGHEDDKNQIDQVKPDTEKQTDQKKTEESQESDSKKTGNTATGDQTNLTFFALTACAALALMGILARIHQKKKSSQE